MIIMTARARKFDNLYKGPPPNTLPQGPHQPKSGPAYVYVPHIRNAKTTNLANQTNKKKD